jgi:hypothetical protein
MTVDLSDQVIKEPDCKWETGVIERNAKRDKCNDIELLIRLTR